MIAHIQAIGDLRSVSGRWAGRPGSGLWIEGVTIHPPDGVAADQIHYQVVLHDRRESPWTAVGAFAGSCGQAQPIRGFRLSRHSDIAARYACSCKATFIDGTQSSPHDADDLCVAPDTMPMESLRVMFVPR